MLTASSFHVWGMCVRPPAQDVVFAGDRRTTYGGWKKSAPVHRWFIPLFPGFLPSQVAQDFFHPQYQLHSTTVLGGKSKRWTACCCLQKSRRTRYHIIIPSFIFYGTVAGISRIFLWLLKDGDQDLRANHDSLIEGSLEAKLPTLWTDEKQSREEAERRGRLEERRCRCAKR